MLEEKKFIMWELMFHAGQEETAKGTKEYSKVTGKES